MGKLTFAIFCAPSASRRRAARSSSSREKVWGAARAVKSGDAASNRPNPRRESFLIAGLLSGFPAREGRIRETHLCPKPGSLCL